MVLQRIENGIGKLVKIRTANGDRAYGVLCHVDAESVVLGHPDDVEEYFSIPRAAIVNVTLDLNQR